MILLANEKHLRENEEINCCKSAPIESITLKVDERMKMQRDVIANALGILNQPRWYSISFYCGGLLKRSGWRNAFTFRFGTSHETVISVWSDDRMDTKTKIHFNIGKDVQLFLSPRKKITITSRPGFNVNTQLDTSTPVSLAFEQWIGQEIWPWKLL